MRMAVQGVARQAEAQLRWLGAVPVGRIWRVPVLEDVFDVDLSAGDVATSAGKEVDPRWSILVLHYLALTSRPEECPPEINFAGLATARAYAGVYQQRVIGRLCATAGRDADTLRAAAEALGGREVAGAGDAAFEFHLFPRLTTRLIWHAPDDEFPPSATLLLPRNVESFFCAEDVVVLSECLVSRLARV